MEMRSKIKIEQVDRIGNVVYDFDHIYSKTEIAEVMKKNFPNVFITNKEIYLTYMGQQINAIVCNISYLGIPHPHFKKRIQISSTVKEKFRYNSSKNIKTLLLGIYSYDNDLIFCDFNIDDYIERNLHNSSAHVYVNDLKRGKEIGYFSKVDFNKNRITVFDTNHVNQFLDSIIFHKNTEISTIEIFDRFFLSINKHWEGTNCYSEMKKMNFPDRNQAEWAGFFLEFLLNEFLSNSTDYGLEILYKKRKKNIDIDLDLFMPKMNAYGDLKMHSTASGAIQGNDFQTVERIITDSKIWYIVCEHDTDKDKNHDYSVTKYWNNSLLKEDTMSYGDKMKYCIDIERYYILEINKYNLV